MKEHLLWIDAKHYCAGAVFDSSMTCIEAAPIIKWMIGKKPNDFMSYLLRKGYKVRWI